MIWLRWAIAGAFLGMIYGLMAPPQATARAVIYFPAVNPQLLNQMTDALRQAPSGEAEATRLTQGNSEIPQLARLILASRTAAQFVTDHSQGAKGPSPFRGDPVEALRSRFTVEFQEPATLALELKSKNAGLARSELQLYLDYYAAFAEKTTLTRVQQTRRWLEQRLAAATTNLGVLEEKLRRLGSTDLRQMGDAALKTNPKLLKELWLRRLEEEGRSRELLDKLQRLRGQTKDARLDPWMKDWARGKKGEPSQQGALVRLPARGPDLVARAKLEREYYEALLLHRSLVLQQSFLLTWEKLENTSFEVVDAVYVTNAGKPVTQNSLIGLCAGGLLGLLLRLKKR